MAALSRHTFDLTSEGTENINDSVKHVQTPPGKHRSAPRPAGLVGSQGANASTNLWVESRGRENRCHEELRSQMAQLSHSWVKRVGIRAHKRAHFGII